MADQLTQSNWYQLPYDLQPYFVLMIANAQKKVYYHGFQIVTLDLEKFTQVSGTQAVC